VHLLPSQLEDAMTLGDGQNPFILAAVYQEEASLYNVAQIEGELLPEATLDAQYSQRFGLSHTLKEQQIFTVIGRVNVPLYQGGGVAARIRQAKETNNQLKKEVEDARLRIHAEVIANWAQLQATASEIQSAQDALEANRIALEGRARGGESRPAHHARRAQRRTRISRLANSACHGQARPRRRRIRGLRLSRAVGRTKPWFISTLL
jgi:outer membrane protein TolC